MAETASFDDLVVSVRRIESTALPKSDFPEKIDARRVLEFSPNEILDQGYHEILNDYSVIQKIISTSKLDIFTSGAGGERKVPQMQTMEIESKVKEITSAALESRMKLEEVTVPPPIEEFEAEKGAEKVSLEKPQPTKPSKSPSAMLFESDFDKELESEFKLEVEKEKTISFEEKPVEALGKEAKSPGNRNLKVLGVKKRKLLPRNLKLKPKQRTKRKRKLKKN